MSENNELRRYNFSDAELKQVATTQIALILRDITDFSPFGFDAVAQTDYQDKLNYFYNYPSDDLLESEKMIHTKAKNDARDVLEQKLRIAFYIAQTTFAKKPAYLRAFGNADLSRQGDFDLMQTAINARQAIDKYLSELRPFGMVQDKIDELTNALKDFSEAYQKQQEAIHQRDISVSERVAAGNEVYDLLTRYAKLGQLLYMEKSHPKHNDYVIYDSYSPSTDANTTPAVDNIAPPPANIGSPSRNQNTTPPPNM
jgi:hypothetical protein